MDEIIKLLTEMGATDIILDEKSYCYLIFSFNGKKAQISALSYSDCELEGEVT